MVKDITDETVTMWSKIGGFFLKVLVALWTFIAPVVGVLVAVGLFILLDTITGIWKAKKKNQKVTSRRLGRIINKMLVYQATVLTFFVLDFFILDEVTKTFLSFDFALTKIVAVVLCSIEIYSIDESFEQATGKGLFERIKDVVSKYKETRKAISGINNEEDDAED